MNKLYLASQSSSRAQLLTQAGIPFTLLAQSADEYACDWTLPLEKLVESIAVHKMDTLNLEAITQPVVWVITADTLCQDAHGTVHAKPADYADAVRQLRAQRDVPVRVATALCLDKKVLKNGTFVTEKRIVQTVVAQVIFSIPDQDIDAYLRNSKALSCAGSMMVDGYGGQFLKTVNGSYSTIIGLPLFEVRQALRSLSFL